MFNNKGFIKFVYGRTEHSTVITNINTYLYFEGKSVQNSTLRPFW